MSDKVQPKGKTAAKGKTPAAPKKAGPKLVAKDIKPGMGHNSGEKHPEVIKCNDEIMHKQEQKKSIAKAERDIRNRLKTEFGILSTSVAREVALRKLDPDVRVQVESNHEDLKKMLGYQPQLDFVAGHATSASQKAQPSEAELNKQGFQVVDEDSDDVDAGLHPDDEQKKDALKIPASLRRTQQPQAAAASHEVIEREG